MNTTTTNDKVLNDSVVLLGLFGVTLFTQLGAILWRYFFARSFQLISLALLFLIPSLWSINLYYWRFVFIQLLFSTIMCFMIYTVRKKPLPPNAPKVVYSWFAIVYYSSYYIAATGGLIFLFLFFFPFSLSTGTFFASIAVHLVFYGCYFGVLGRDCAEMSTTRLANTLGYSSKESLPSRQLVGNICCVCDHPLLDSKTITLSCNHIFHENCIRGWSIIGKKDVCPYCSEKVDFRSTFSTQPWKLPTEYWGQVLDGFRILVVFLPIILVATKVILQDFLHYHPVVKVET